MNKQEIMAEEVINLGDRIIMPTQRELINSKRYKLPVLPLSPFAVFVKKMVSTQRNTWTGNINIDKATIQEICSDYDSYNFLLNFQYKRGIVFTQTEMDYLENVQQIPELNYICMNEENANQDATSFETQLKGWKTRNPTKTIVPVMESDTSEHLKKIAVMKREGVKRCAVIFRGYSSSVDRANLSRMLANLRTAGIYSLVFGVNPKKWGKTEASMFLPPLQFRANAVSSWIAWGGGMSTLTFLCSDWVYRNTTNADVGLANYNGTTRASLTQNSVVFNTALSQIDTVNQAALMAKSFSLLPKVQFESLFN